MWWKCLTPAFGLLKRTNTKEFADSLQAETNLWHLHSTTSRAFYKPGMQPGRKKQWLKRVTGSAVISLSWENARDFSSFVRSIQEVISFPINYLPCREKRKKKKISYLQHEQLSLLSFQNYQNRQCGEASYTVMCVPSHFFDKEQWLPHNSRVSSEVGGGITIIQRHVLSCDKFCFHRPNPLVPLCWKYSELVIEI